MKGYAAMKAKGWQATAVRLATLCVVALFVLVGGAARAGDMVNGRGVLWKVTPPGAPASYVFGTMHSPDPRVLDLPDPVRYAFARSQVVAFEVLIAGEAAAQATAEMMRSMLLADGRRLEDIVGTEVFEAMARGLESVGLPRAAVQRLKPWGAYLLLLSPHTSFDASAPQPEVLDQRLEHDARRQGKRVVALETVAEQIEVFAGMDEGDVVWLLEGMIGEAGADGDLRGYVADYLQTLTELYLTGDIGGIIELTSAQLPEDDAASMARLLERMFDRRNEAMVERMGPLIARGDAFVAIGAAHLPGEAGVVSLLADKGYEMTRLY
jgi:uncharacterized protein YbaP (TraB family)